MRTSKHVLLVLLVTTCSSLAQKSFLKGLLIGSLLGHKKASFMKEENLQKNHHAHIEHDSYEEHKEYIPVPMPPKYIPIYIIKECTKKHVQEPVMHVHQHAYTTMGTQEPFPPFEGNELPVDEYSPEASSPLPVNRQSKEGFEIDLSID